jgi:hypothetical protein
MRTTIRLDDQLLKEVKKLAVDSGRTLTAVIEDALRDAIARKQQKAQKREWISLPTTTADIMPGVNLDDSAALLVLMEESDDSPRR